ncbi:MAG TPA: hypothetical protein VNZ57_14080 [Longimicrobiales bacterium]|nr:hypothetical protein [Longimicrobiales bacterium]
MADRHEATGFGAEGGTGERIREATHQLREKVPDAARDVRERGEHLIEEGMEKGRELTHDARRMARSRLDEGRERIASGMRAVARALRRGGEDLPGDQEPYAKFVSGVADRVEGVSRYLDQHDVDELGREASRFAREHAPVVLGGAFVLGLVGARFLKSAPEEPRPGEYRRDLPYESHTLRGSVERLEGESRWPPAIPDRQQPIQPGREGDGHARL